MCIYIYSLLSSTTVDDMPSDDYDKEEEEEEMERESGGKEYEEYSLERTSGGKGEKTEIDREKEEEGMREEMVKVPWQTLALASTSKEKKGKDIGLVLFCMFVLPSHGSRCSPELGSEFGPKSFVSFFPDVRSPIAGTRCLGLSLFLTVSFRCLSR